jgi:bromodomain-containing factor 1
VPAPAPAPVVAAPAAGYQAPTYVPRPAPAPIQRVYPEPIQTNFGHSSRAANSAASNITKEQFRYLQSVMREIKKSPSANPFIKPVDDVALKIPDYYRIVKNPMDLGTISERVDKKLYMDIREFEIDMQLIFSNCYLYNGQESVVSKMARVVEDDFQLRMKNFPAFGSGGGGEDTPASPKVGSLSCFGGLFCRH